MPLKVKYEKEEPQIEPRFKISGEYCPGCGARLIWGQFAYRQELCWDCYAKQVIYISSKTQTLQDREIMVDLLNTKARRHGIEKNYILVDQRICQYGIDLAKSGGDFSV